MEIQQQPRLLNSFDLTRHLFAKAQYIGVRLLISWTLKHYGN
jgi:hypothetical protein